MGIGTKILFSKDDLQDMSCPKRGLARYQNASRSIEIIRTTVLPQLFALRLVRPAILRGSATSTPKTNIPCRLLHRIKICSHVTSPGVVFHQSRIRYSTATAAENYPGLTIRQTLCIWTASEAHRVTHVLWLPKQKASLAAHADTGSWCATVAINCLKIIKSFQQKATA